MRLQQRLALFLILTYSIVFIIAGVSIYLLFGNWLLKSKIQNLQNKTLLAAMYYLEEDEISVAEHQSLREKLRKAMSRKDIAVYDINHIQVKGEMTNDPDITQSFIQSIKDKQTQYIKSNKYFYNGLLYNDNQGDFIIITREDNAEYFQQKNTLLQILIFVFILGLGVMYWLSIWLSKLAYTPIIKIVDQLREKDYQNFSTPLYLHNSYVEIDTLIKAYNQFIEQIAQTFHIQKNFIDYVSHELRTPITALLGTLEVSKFKIRTVEEYEKILSELKQYVFDLENTLDNMMLLSGAKTNFEFTSIRIDEVIWKVIEDAYIYHNSKIEIEINVEKPETLVRKINASLLELALTNIVENAIKYSDNKPIKITVTSKNEKLFIEIIDQGIGVLKEDLNHITSNFYRGKNTVGYQGKGIGLSISSIIFKIHHIDMQITSQSQGTIVTLIF